MDRISRIKGSLVGLATGDALGVPLEFTKPGAFKQVTDFLGGGLFDLEPGVWTDDTSMALCLAESLTNTNQFNPADQLERYLLWYRTGHLSCMGHCFDIGVTTRQALQHYERTRIPEGGCKNLRSAGNGSLMRVAPVPLAFHRSPLLAIEYSGKSSDTTHGLLVCIDACRYLGALITGAMRGASKEKLLSPLYSPVKGNWTQKPLYPDIEAVARGSFLEKEPPEIKGSGFVVRSLEAALWAFYTRTTFEEGCILAVNLGDDADTTGAIYGQLAGAYYGIDGIPDRWKRSLVMYDLILEFAQKLSDMSETITNQ